MQICGVQEKMITLVMMIKDNTYQINDGYGVASPSLVAVDRQTYFRNLRKKTICNINGNIPSWEPVCC